ncbi:MAG TPA: putative zinc-binding protein [Elusimicrobiota bacterium]|nr:putative zinc-binding protein [Elusimicrobiota bacterium]
MAEKSSCGCGGGTVLIYPCSGAADTGEIADRAARVLSREGIGKMSCLAGIGGRLSGFLASAKGADAVLLIDGCPLDCAKNTMEQAGVTRFQHMRVTDAGLEKGKSPATPERVKRVAEKAKSFLKCRPGGRAGGSSCCP